MKLPPPWFVVDRQKPYVMAHPLAYWFALGVALTGLLSLLGLTAQSSNSLTLPDWLQTMFQVTWFVGGLASVIGISTGKARYEAAGMTLIAVGLVVLLATTLHLSRDRIHDLAGLSFIVTLAIGCGLRAWHLTKGGGYFDPGIIDANLDRKR